MTWPTSRRPSIGPLGSDTLIGSSLALLGGESIQSDDLTADQRTGEPRDPGNRRRRRRPAIAPRRFAWRGDGAGGTALTPGAGGGSEVMDLCLSPNANCDPVGVAVLDFFTTRSIPRGRTPSVAFRRSGS